MPTKHRSIRIDGPSWEAFDAAAKILGTDKSALIRAFVDWLMRYPGARLPARLTREQAAEVLRLRAEKAGRGEG